MTWRCTPPILVYWLPAGPTWPQRPDDAGDDVLSATAVRIGAALTRDWLT